MVVKSSLQISVRGRNLSSNPGEVQSLLSPQNAASTGWWVFPCGPLPVDAAKNTHLHRLAIPWRLCTRENNSIWGMFWLEEVGGCELLRFMI